MARTGRNHMHRHVTFEQVSDVQVPEPVELGALNPSRDDLPHERHGKHGWANYCALGRREHQVTIVLAKAKL